MRVYCIYVILTVKTNVHHKMKVYRWLHKEDECNSDTQRLLNAPRHLISKTCSAKRLFLVLIQTMEWLLKKCFRAKKLCNVV